MTTLSSSAMTTTNTTTSTTSHHDNLLQKLERNDSFTTWLTLSRNHLGMDLCRLSAALNANSHITKVSCHAHFVANLSTHSLTRLLKACASLSALEELWVALPSNRSHLSSTVVETIAAVSNSNLKKLSIRGVNPEACSTVAQSLSSGALVQLEELNLYGDCSTAACLDVLQVLETTNTCCSLQKLVLPRVTVNTACCQSLARVLTVNRTLTKLDFLGGASTNNNATTTGGSKKTKACQEVVDVLASGQNTTLTSLQLLDTNPELQSALTFYTEINRANIPALLQQSTISCEEFWHVVQQGNNNSNDCSLLYHVLLQAPQWLASGFDNNRNSSSNGGSFQKQKLSPIKTSRRTSLPFLSKPVRRVATVATVVPTKSNNNHVVVDKTHRRCSEPILRVSVADLCASEMDPSTEETPKQVCPTKKSEEYPSQHGDNQKDDCAMPLTVDQPLVIQQRSVNKTLQKTTEPENEQTLPKWNESRPICPRYKAHSTRSVPKEQARTTITSTSSSFAIPLTRQHENHKNTTSNNNNNNNGETKKRVSKVLQTAHVFGEPAAFSTPWKGAELRA
ncbi:expressed unknown protein [Seminavis robusta]|uniref:Uncharacterized protein n=1 Tax=Seminavis robusta TaxID=568900 RepID=A0A9N8DYR7_9STRA|nr:expressed unknown protein [Seminavis robusta]|eukprot:Sro375_g129490.1 n/a (566) ;mRNA; r:46150-47847